MAASSVKKELAQTSAPMWMVTFADLMALMLTLFILLLTFSEMNVIRYQAVIGSLKNALGTAPESSLAGVIELDGSLMRKSAANTDPSNTSNDSASAQSAVPVRPEDLTPQEIEQMETEVRMMLAEELTGELRDALAESPGASGVEVEQRVDEVVLTFPSEVTFASGQARLNREFNDVISSLAPAITSTAGMLVVSGHTDNQPISGGRFRSNWDLSAARAASVTMQLLNSGVNAGRLTIQGYADSRPLAPNDTPEGRSKNRRIELIIKLNDHDDYYDGGAVTPQQAEDFRRNF